MEVGVGIAVKWDQRVAVLRDQTFLTRPLGASCPASGSSTPALAPAPSLPGPKERPAQNHLQALQALYSYLPDRRTDSAARAVGPHHWHLGFRTRPNPVPGILRRGFQSGLRSAPQTAPCPTLPPPTLQKQSNKLRGENKKRLRIRKRVPLPLSKKSFCLFPSVR